MEGTERQDRTIQLISLAHQGDKEARDALVEENVGLIWSIVRRFAGRGCETEDLFQIGSIGLMKAIDKFDTAFDVKFSTYAVPMIMGEIKRFLRDDGIIKVSRSIREMGIRVSASRQKLSGTLGREPTLEELAEDVGASREEVAVSLEAGVQVESLYAPAAGGEETNLSLLDRVGGENGGQEEALNRLVLRELLGSLKKEERDLIVRRYFYDQTQTKIAEAMGISQVQVSRMEKRILKKMREGFE